MTIRPAVATAVLLALLAPSTVLATAQRTFVASSGSDVQPCTLSEPCRSFATAIGKTSDKGEVVVVDSAGYGPVTIAQSVSIIAASGVYAGVTFTAGTGVQIDGSGIAVVLRGLAINGLGDGFGIGFYHGARLSIEGCEVAQANGTGVYISAPNSRVLIQNTVIRDSLAGVLVGGVGGGIQVSIANSEIANNEFDGVSVDASGTTVQVTLARSILSNNQTALTVHSSGGGNASILSDGNTITYSNTVFQFGTAGGGGIVAIFTAGNNTVGYYGTLVAGGTLSPCCGI